MGVDVYLKWKGMTEEEKKRQYTGFSIDAGRFGYLRASIWMQTEFDVLSLVFPDECWKGWEYKRYKFDELGFAELEKILLAYLISKTSGRPLKSLLEEAKVVVRETEDAKQRKATMDRMIAKANEIKNAGECVKTGGETSLLEAIVWSKSLLDFYKLGLEKEKEGKEPEVLVSW